MFEQLTLKLWSLFVAADGYELRAFTGIVLAIAIAVLVYRRRAAAVRRAGSFLGETVASMMMLIRNGIIGALFFLVFCLFYAFMVPTEAKVATKYGAIEVGIQLICASVAPNDPKCFAELLYDPKSGTQVVRHVPNSRIKDFGDHPSNQTPTGNEIKVDENSLLAPTVILPDEPESTRSDVDEHPEVFGLPDATDQNPSEDISLPMPPTNLLPGALAEMSNKAPLG
jgi:hypothetical protein